MTDFRALCAELLEAYEIELGELRFDNRLAKCARAALAEPELEGPTKAELRQVFDDQSGYINDEQVMWWSDFHAAARAVLARWGRPAPQPVPVSERLPERIERALIKAECALSDIAEGEAEESEGDALEWAEKRAADALARIRPVMRQHQIQTSEWPPLPAHALPVPAPTN